MGGSDLTNIDKKAHVSGLLELMIIAANGVT